VAVAKISCDQRPAFRIHRFKGFGAQLNTNVFRPTSIFPDAAMAAKEHPEDREREGQPRALTAAQRVTLGEAVTNLSLGHSRVFVGRSLMATREPPAKELAAFLETLRLAQAAGGNVNLTFWGKGPYAGKAKLQRLSWPDPQVRDWPRQKERQGKLKWPKALMDGGELTGPAESMRRFANLIALARHEGLACVQSATIQNEPNGSGTDLAQQRNPGLSMRLYERLYRLLDAELRKLGVRDAIGLVGGDLVLAGNSPQNDWLKYIRAHMGQPRPKFGSGVDGYSIHVYWAPGDGAMGFPQRLESRLKGLASVLKSAGIDKPVFVTEYGVRVLNAKPEPGGLGSGQKIEFSTDVAFQHAWFMALAPQYGCAGLTKWVLYRTDRRSAWGEWGMIDAPNPDAPRASFGRSPCYRVTRLFNHLVDSDWTADGFGKSSDGTLLASRFKGDGQESIALLNRRSQAQQVVIAGLRATKYFAADWNQDRQGGPAIERDQPLVPNGGSLPITVPARGVVGLSSRPLQLG